MDRIDRIMGHPVFVENLQKNKAAETGRDFCLADCGFTRQEMEMVTKAIEAHRDASVAGEKSLKGILYLADKASRPCFSCEAEPECNWKGDKKNLKVRY